MTTFQDQPLSRRAVRQQEREQAQPGAVPPTGDADQPRAPQQGGQPASAQPDVAPEPLTYVTQNRPPLPRYAGSPDAAQPTPAQPDDTSTSSAPPASDSSHAAGAYRSRDFSPEGRSSAAPSWAPQFGGVSDEGAIEYQTQGRVPQIPDAIPPAAAAPLPEDDPFAVVEQTMTRRELRALREAHEAARSQAAAEATATAVTASSPVIPSTPPAAPVLRPAAPDPTAAPTSPTSSSPDAPTERPEPANRLNSAVAEFDQLIDARGDSDVASRGRRASAPATNEAPAVSAPPPAPAPTASAPATPTSSASAPATPTSSAPVAPQPIPLVEPPAPHSGSDRQGLRQVPPPIQLPEAQEPSRAEASAATTSRAPESSPVAPAASAPEVAAAQASAPVAPVSPSAATPAEETGDPAAFDQLLSPPSADQIAPEDEVAGLASHKSPVSDVVVDVRPSSPLATPEPAATSETVATPEPVAEDTTTPPTGHWSTQAELEDEAQVGSATLAGGVGIGSAPLTTSALVLPSIPTGDFAP
ncbi:MAG TPA: hypothetical protein VNT53_04600, partial [Pseudolysinimonas sp.]|nr:hypothetical protein [Pseudolysinimonas sp.]